MKWNIYISGFKIWTFENNRKEVLCAGLGYSLLSKSLIQPLLLNQLCFSFQSHVHDHAGCTESRCRDSDQLHVGTIQERFTCTKRISLTHWLIRRVDIYFFFFSSIYLCFCFWFIILYYQTIWCRPFFMKNCEILNFFQPVFFIIDAIYIEQKSCLQATRWS